jgi:hypothetical protein
VETTGLKARGAVRATAPEVWALFVRLIATSIKGMAFSPVFGVAEVCSPDLRIQTVGYVLSKSRSLETLYRAILRTDENLNIE